MRRLLGLFPHKGLPSGSLALDETNVQVPTSCSLSDFCCATAGSANPSQIAVVKTIMSAVRRFMVPPCGSAYPLGTVCGFLHHRSVLSACLTCCSAAGHDNV